MFVAARVNFDEEALRSYFPAKSVLGGAFETVRRSYRITIEALPDVSGWDRKVTAYQIKDEDQSRLGSFYVDLYPRENKRDGAWMHGLLTASPPSPHLGPGRNAYASRMPTIRVASSVRTSTRSVNWAQFVCETVRGSDA